MTTIKLYGRLLSFLRAVSEPFVILLIVMLFNRVFFGSTIFLVFQSRIGTEAVLIDPLFFKEQAYDLVSDPT